MKLLKEDIIDIENKLVEGIKHSDVKFLDAVLHDQLLFIVPNGQVITKETDLASHTAGHMSVEKLEAVIEDIRVIDETAIVVVVYDTKGTMLGESIKGRFRYIRIWKLFDEGLKVIGGSCIQLPS